MRDQQTVKSLDTRRRRGISAVPIWSFSAAVPTSRAEALNRWRSFNQIVAKIVSEATVIASEWEPFKDQRLAGCHRASFEIRVSTDAYDAFFNAPVGYRG